MGDMHAFFICMVVCFATKHPVWGIVFLILLFSTAGVAIK